MSASEPPTKVAGTDVTNGRRDGAAAPAAGTEALTRARVGGAVSSPGELPRPAYGRSARVLAVGVAATGIVTFLYFTLASHALSEVAYNGIAVLWSVMFVIISIIYRPVEQLLSRTIADRRARGLQAHPLRTVATIQAAFALTFLVVALVFRDGLVNDVFAGSTTLYWVLVFGVLAYALSYFARGWLAGNQRFVLYGGLMLIESCGRCMFALAAFLGIAGGQSVVALGIAFAPIVSIVVVPFAWRKRRTIMPGTSSARDRERFRAGAADAAFTGPGAESVEEASGLTLARGSGFAVSVFVIMLAEQTLLNAAVLIVDGTASNPALAGFVFNALLIVRAPLQLFQAIQTSLLPHLTSLEATAGSAEFRRAIRSTVLVLAGLATALSVALLAIGPWAMGFLFGGDFDYTRGGLALLSVGMGLHLISGTLNQAALARRQAPLAAACWLIAAVVFVGWLALPVVGDEILRVEIGYFGAALLLLTLLSGVYVLGNRTSNAVADSAAQGATAAADVEVEKTGPSDLDETAAGDPTSLHPKPVPTGNTYDKYGSPNPIVRHVMANFQGTLDELFEAASPESILDIGCGEAILTHEWARRLGDAPVVGIDLEDDKLQAEWETRRRPNLDFRVMRAEHLPFEDDEFDVATAIEVLEHVPDPEHTVAEMARCARRYLIVSVPREPVWRGLNMLRGAYWRDMGNTPGHLNHWSKRSFSRLLSQHGEVVETRSPFPWTMLLVRL